MRNKLLVGLGCLIILCLPLSCMVKPGLFNDLGNVVKELFRPANEADKAIERMQESGKWDHWKNLPK